MSLECYRAILGQADPDDVRFGRSWYKNTNLQVHKLANETGYTPEQVAGVIAVLSPMVEWTLNLRSAVRFLKSNGKAKGIPGFASNRRKAREVLRGNLDAVRGPKVRAFYETMLNPDHEFPVIDTQMIAAFYESVAYRDDLKVVSQSEKRKAPIYEAVRTLASERGWTIAETQAVLWTTFKRLNGPYADQLKLWR